ncbi:ROK family protein [Sediminivirga luteola]|uniref:ROK family protein n=1 Tax=Sediminivirga luteola TaxID=1774748 RepID=UPI001F57388D|nr:ROK family protein [Sediminivirga luteola]
MTHAISDPAGAQGRLGMDMGGTNIRWVFLDRRGAIADHGVQQLPRHAEARQRVPGEIVRRYQGRICAAGLAIAGTVDDGRITWSANLGLADIDYDDELRRAGAPRARVLNDAQAAGLAEARIGAGRGHRLVLVLTIGTGIGGAVVLEGGLLEGNRPAGEVGHMVVDPSGPECNCGRRGCWERIAGGRALAELAAERGKTIVEFEQAARWDGSPEAVLLGERADAFAAGVDSLCAILAPEALVLGGGVMARRGVIAQKYTEALSGLRWGAGTRVLHSQLGDAAGAHGAALAAGDRAREHPSQTEANEP